MRDTATILIIDDEPVVLQFLRLILKRAGHNVLVACDGQQALELCAAVDDCIDLAISDITMPSLSGPEVLACLRERIPGLPGILTSGFGGGDELVAAGHRFVQKPFRADNVLEAVKEVLSADSLRITAA